MRIAGRIRAQRAAARRADRRNRVLLAVGRVVAVLAVVLTFPLVKADSKAGTAPLASNGPDRRGASQRAEGCHWHPLTARCLPRPESQESLSAIHSSTSDSPSDIPSWALCEFTCTSKYLSFVPGEETRNHRRVILPRHTVITCRSDTGRRAARPVKPGRPVRGRRRQLPHRRDLRR